MKDGHGKRPKRAKKRLVRRKISTLKSHPQQPGLFPMSEYEVAELAESMEREGQLVPIEILPSGIIVCGHRRVAAAKKLGWKDILCWVRDDLLEAGEEAVEQRLIEDNFGRQQLSGLAIARCYLRLKELRNGRGGCSNGFTGDFRDYVGQRFKLTGRTLDRFVKILDAPLAVQIAYEDGFLKQGPAIAIATRLDEDTQGRVAKKIQAARAKGGTPDEVKQRIAKIVENYFPRNGRPKSLHTAWRRLKTALTDALAAFDGESIAFAIAREDRDLLRSAIILQRELVRRGKKNEEDADAALREYLEDQQAAEDGEDASS